MDFYIGSKNLSQANLFNTLTNFYQNFITCRQEILFIVMVVLKLVLFKKIPLHILPKFSKESLCFFKVTQEIANSDWSNHMMFICKLYDII